MNYIITTAIGIGVGILAYFLMRPQPIAHGSYQARQRRKEHELPYMSKPDDDCPICMEKMSNCDMTYLRCSHALHANCLQKLRQNGLDSCPICRERI